MLLLIITIISDIVVRASNWTESELWAPVDSVSKYWAEVMKKKYSAFVTASAWSDAWAGIGQCCLHG